ncbi:MAG: hypothetical protein GY804_07985 [Alphaproteobacteria bacterium]|nr:hypothetical protein [Alphaproteobacteria bacterium]
MVYLVLVMIVIVGGVGAFFVGKRVGGLEKEKNYANSAAKKYSKYIKATAKPLRSVSDIVERMRNGKL